MITLILQLLQVIIPNNSHICFPRLLSNTTGSSGPCKSRNSLSLRSTKYCLPPKYTTGKPLKPRVGCFFSSFILPHPAKPNYGGSPCSRTAVFTSYHVLKDIRRKQPYYLLAGSRQLSFRGTLNIQLPHNQNIPLISPSSRSFIFFQII